MVNPCTCAFRMVNDVLHLCVAIIILDFFLKGNKVRELKAAKADKNDIKKEVNTLLALKDKLPTEPKKSATEPVKKGNEELAKKLEEEVKAQVRNRK